MNSLDIRNNSAVMKRAEQLKRWEESDTNREPPTPRPERGRKIKFSSGCVFLAACLSGDKEEVLKLLENGADINTANVDGLTALHQACIDDNLDMVEFLVENGADINRQDNEGWTPLHATASCGFVSIARYLVEHGADVAAVNSDGDLAVDLAVDIQHLPMIEFMQQMVNEHNVDCEKARKAEEQSMLADAKKWLRSDASEVDRPHPKTGATALHVAAAKGYTKVLSLLLAGRGNVDKQDNDGWTPLHAAAHWAQKEASEMLIDAMADMDVRNYAGQTCIDVADGKMIKFLEDMRANSKRIKRRPSSQIRISDTIENHFDNTPTKIIRVEVKPDQSKDQSNDDKSKSKTSLTNEQQQPIEDEAPWRRNNSTRVRQNNEQNPTKIQVPDKDSNKINTTQNATSTSMNTEPSDVILRRTQSFEHDEKSFVPPTRDEESETQRKAHAKRVRETRRSTQGVTLDEIKSAEELVKKKNSAMNNNNSSSFKLEDASSGKTYPPNNSTIIPSAPAVIAAANLSSTIGPRRLNSGGSALTASNQSINSIGRPISATTLAPGSSSSPSDISSAESSTQIGIYLTPRKYPSSTSTSSTITYGGNTTSNTTLSNTPTTATPTTNASTTTTGTTVLKNNDEKENDKENENRSSLAAQAVIQRRRKPKRRSTGVVHLDMDEIDPDRQDTNTNDSAEDKESGGERLSRSRGGSTASIAASTSDDKKSNEKTENGEPIDYKALWEASKLENEKLRQQLKKKDDEVLQSRATVERFASATSKNSLTEIEKRERRAMERKLSEMEEELKQLEIYKSENQRLKEENGALIRVISKLSK